MDADTIGTMTSIRGYRYTKHWTGISVFNTCMWECPCEGCPLWEVLRACTVVSQRRSDTVDLCE